MIRVIGACLCGVQKKKLPLFSKKEMEDVMNNEGDTAVGVLDTLFQTFGKSG
jgi:hypothetical protein